jgi:hypothetical protein
LVPYHLKELPRDPVSGEALEYEKIPNGFRIYAVDATDRKTEGGRKKNQSEVAFTVLRWGVETPAPGHDAGIDE